MDNINIEVLISEVQSHPVLWQDSQKDYKNKNVTEKMWKEVGAVCNCSGEAAKGKWKNLKDTYRRNLPKIPPSKSGSEALAIKIKWPYFNAMSFIKQSIVSDPTEGNLLGPEQYQYTDQNNYTSLIEDLLTDEDSVFRTVDMPGTSTPASTTCSTYVPKKKRARKSTAGDFGAEFLQIERERMSILKAEVEKKEEDDDDLQFFKSFLPYMKQFNSLQKLEVRGEIQSVILNKYRKSFVNNQENTKDI